MNLCNSRRDVSSVNFGVWIGVGVAIGVATHQLALFLALGAAMAGASEWAFRHEDPKR